MAHRSLEAGGPFIRASALGTHTKQGVAQAHLEIGISEGRIKELEGQVAEAAKTAEAADALRGVIEQVKARAADERAE